MGWLDTLRESLEALVGSLETSAGSLHTLTGSLETSTGSLHTRAIVGCFSWFVAHFRRIFGHPKGYVTLLKFIQKKKPFSVKWLFYFY